MGICLGNALCHRIKGIDFLQGYKASHRSELSRILVIVQIIVMSGRENHIMPFPDSLQASKDTLFIRPKQKDARPVLLFFWATWKRSSLDDFYLVRKALRQNKELQPVSISLDYNASTYAYSLRADSIDFDRRCYRLIWDTPIVQQLAVRDIPYYILADANRRVIALGSDWKHDLQPAVDSLLNSRKDVQRP